MPELAERLDGLRINVPSLRQRKEDIPKLIEYFCSKLSPERRSNISENLKKRFSEYDWPGNIRQLHNCVRQSSLNFIPDYLSNSTKVPQEIEDTVVQQVKILLRENKNLSINEAAEKIGISRFALHRKLQSFGTSWKQIKQEIRRL